MASHQHAAKTQHCPICNRDVPIREIFPGSIIHGPLVDYIRSIHPNWTPEQNLCLDCLHRLRSEYVMNLLQQEAGEVNELHREVTESLIRQELSTRNIEDMFDQKATLGERVADRVADFGGSWKFIGLFGGILILWMVVNTSVLGNPFDPYPFILLNLVLSCLAALQAPVIMMSQNRQETKDRMRGENDYRINLKAELEIRHLHDKLDLLLNSQWEKLMDLQALQMDMMEELARKK